MTKEVFIHVFLITLTLSGLVSGLSFGPISFSKALDGDVLNHFVGRGLLSAFSASLQFGVKLEIEDDALHLKDVHNGEISVFRDGQALDLTFQSLGVSVMQGDIVVIRVVNQIPTRKGKEFLANCFTTTSIQDCIEKQHESSGDLIFGTALASLSADEANQPQRISFATDQGAQWIAQVGRRVGDLPLEATATIISDNMVRLSVRNGACILVIRRGLSVPTNLGCSTRLIAKSQPMIQSTLRLEQGDNILLITPKSASIKSRPWGAAIEPFRMHPEESLEEKTRKFFAMNPKLSGKVVLVQ